VGLNQVAGVGVQPREATVPFMGKAAKLRRRLRIDTHGGRDLFIVNRVEDAVAELNRGSADDAPQPPE